MIKICELTLVGNNLCRKILDPVAFLSAFNQYIHLLHVCSMIIITKLTRWRHSLFIYTFFQKFTRFFSLDFTIFTQNPNTH